MTEKKILTIEAVTNNDNINNYLSIGRLINDTLSGQPSGTHLLTHLCVLADLMRLQFPERFCYLETESGIGESISALSYHTVSSKIEKYAGVRVDHINETDRNIRYFGVREGFALMSYNVNQIKAYTRGSIHMLYITGCLNGETLVEKFFDLSDMVEPGGVVAFADYHNEQAPHITTAIDEIIIENAAGFRVIGGLVKNAPTLFVLQKL